MKLLHAPTSPFARKARVIILEYGLENQVELQQSDPYDYDDDLHRITPLKKVPALLFDDGRILVDSPNICAYLMDMVEDKPAKRDVSYWDSINSQALADGIMQAAFNTVMEYRRPEAQRSEEWLTRWSKSISETIEALEAKAGGLENKPNLTEIGVACALDYLAFRLSKTNWLANAPQLSAWLNTYLKRPSMIKTDPG